MKHPRITDSEWPLLEILWQEDRAIGLGEMVELLAARSGAEQQNPRTIATYLSRLTEKGAIGVSKLGRNNLYEALVDQRDCVRGETRNFLQRVFKGATAPAILHLVEEHDLSDADIAELEKILRQKKS